MYSQSGIRANYRTGLLMGVTEAASRCLWGGAGKKFAEGCSTSRPSSPSLGVPLRPSGPPHSWLRHGLFSARPELSSSPELQHLPFSPPEARLGWTRLRNAELGEPRPGASTPTPRPRGLPAAYHRPPPSPRAPKAERPTGRATAAFQASGGPGVRRPTGSGGLASRVPPLQPG